MVSIDYERENIKVKALSKAINYQAYNSYSSGKIYSYLLKANFDKDISLEVVREMIEKGYIDDKKSCEKLLLSRVGKKQESKNLLFERLINYGIDKNVAQDYVDELKDDQITCLYLMEALLSGRDINDLDEITFRKFINTVKRRGYSSSIISLTLNELHYIRSFG